MKMVLCILALMANSTLAFAFETNPHRGVVKSLSRVDPVLFTKTGKLVGTNSPCKVTMMKVRLYGKTFLAFEQGDNYFEFSAETEKVFGRSEHDDIIQIISEDPVAIVASAKEDTSYEQCSYPGGFFCRRVQGEVYEAHLQMNEKEAQMSVAEKKFVCKFVAL